MCLGINSDHMLPLKLLTMLLYKLVIPKNDISHEKCSDEVIGIGSF